MTILTQKQLRETLHYDPQTGIFRFRHGKRRGRMAGNRHDAREFLRVMIRSRCYPLSHLAMLWMTGALPCCRIVHLNGDRSDNRWSNLRESDHALKAAHRPPWRQPTCTPGVWKVGERFVALVRTADGSQLVLSAHETEQDAIAALERHRYQAFLHRLVRPSLAA